MSFGFGGILGVLILLVDIWAILKIVKSSKPPLNKLIWIVVILALPVIGLLLWLFLNEKSL